MLTRVSTRHYSSDEELSNLFDSAHRLFMVTITMKHVSLVLCGAFCCGCLNAQTNAWQPSRGHTQMPLWPKGASDAQPVSGQEYVTNVLSPSGVSWIAACNVS